jgi:hypothetical protein
MREKAKKQMAEHRFDLSCCKIDSLHTTQNCQNVSVDVGEGPVNDRFSSGPGFLSVTESTGLTTEQQYSMIPCCRLIPYGVEVDCVPQKLRHMGAYWRCDKVLCETTTV